MAPSRKELFEKNAWSWVDNCNPFEVSEEHVQTAYRINLSRCKIGACRRNCRGNPFCLSNLGEHRWLGSHEDFISDEVSDPEKERRKPGSYVGLKNLGATCYVNSLLQLWFHNLNFRKAIFMWDPLQDPEEKQNITMGEDKFIPLTVLGHLQATFALMKYGQRRLVDPTDFISSLRLDTSIQQDAQEFSKLFLSKLETILGYQSIREVRDLIKNNFCGEYSYVTRCMKCKMESKRPSKFYELDLNIKGHKTIQDCLREFMNVEMLEGDDKYFCQICGEKQDAQRFISLTELPPVLNLQLMRFVFDKNTGYKKKLNTFVQFPDKLNMSEFCPNVKGNMEYTLSAVLVHGGRSANSGHYVAHICDSQSGTWYKFNDELVERIEGKKLKLGTEDEYEDGGKKVKIPRAPKGSYHSLNAYMLVYTRNDVVSSSLCDEKNESDVVAVDEWNLPHHLHNFVSEQNAHFESWVMDVKKSNDITAGRNHDQQIEMASYITLLSVEPDNDNYEAVPTSWLTHWLSDPEVENVIDNEKHACGHFKLDPSQVSNVKYINSEMADKLFDRYGAVGESRFKFDDFLCRDCVIAKCLKIRVKNKIQHEVKIITNKLKTKLRDSEIGYWIGKVSLRSWRRMALENLENGSLDYNGVDSLLNDVEMSNGKGTTTLCKREPCESLDKEIVRRVTGERTCKNGNSTNHDRHDAATSNDNQMETEHETPKNIVKLENNGQDDDNDGDDDDDDDENEDYDMIKNDVRVDLAKCFCCPSSVIVSKLEECYSLSANSDDTSMRDLNESLAGVLKQAKKIHIRCDRRFMNRGDAPCTQEMMVKQPQISSYNGAYHNFLQNRDKTLDMNTVDDMSIDTAVVLVHRSGGTDHCNEADQNGTAKSYSHSSASGGGMRNHDEDAATDGDADTDQDSGRGHDSGNRNVVERDENERNRRCRRRRQHDYQLYERRTRHNNHDNNNDSASSSSSRSSSCGNSNSDDKNIAGAVTANSFTTSTSATNTSVTFTTASTTTNADKRNRISVYNNCGDYNVNCSADVSDVNDTKILLNGEAGGTSARTKSVDNEDEGSTCETRFNEDLLCSHGNLCMEESNRRLVSEEVWRILKKYFPHANEFTSQCQPCSLCKSIASEYEVAKDMYKTEASHQKELLSDLYFDRNRPSLKYRDAADAENVFYVINKEFINSWRKFIRENGKKEPPYSMKNQPLLLCSDHLGLLYDLKQDIPNSIVLLTQKEWLHLCAAYNADSEISVKCMPDGSVLTKPDVCVPCMLNRIENEEKAQLCYTKAKIYIKIQNDEETEYLSNDETRPQPKRIKLSTNSNNGNAPSAPNTNGNLARYANGASGSPQANVEIRDVDLAYTSSGTAPASTATIAANARVSRIETNKRVDSSNDVRECGANAINHQTDVNAVHKDPSANVSDIVGNGIGANSIDSATAVRRSSRCRRVRGVKEITVSSDLTLLDVKKKICEIMSVAPMDQHLFTCDGRSLTENTATLTELSIYPETTLHLKVDEPCEGVIADDFIVNREPEAGFKGTSLVGG